MVLFQTLTARPPFGQKIVPLFWPDKPSKRVSDKKILKKLQFSGPKSGKFKPREGLVII
jgi:hypothetical protein